VRPDPLVAEESLDAVQRRARLRGIALMCLAGLCFSSIDTCAKYLNLSMSTTEVVWARFLGAMIVVLFMVNVFRRPAVVLSNRPWLQIFRSFALLTSTLLNLYALRFLQLDQTLSIMFAAPFIVAVLAIPLLGERIGPRRWAAICVGFFGVLVVTRPGAGGIHPAAVFSLMAACTYSLYAISTRVLASADSNQTTVFHTNFIGAIVMSILVPFSWITPDAKQIAIMILMSLISAFGHYLLILAHRLAPASILAPFMYTQLAWMIFYGYTVFGDLPNHWTLAGAAIVIASGLYLLNRERKVKGPEAPMSGDPVA
jgi:drug/metabolite transporter (DMT)-like permease